MRVRVAGLGLRVAVFHAAWWDSPRLGHSSRIRGRPRIKVSYPQSAIRLLGAGLESMKRMAVLLTSAAS